MPNQYKNKVVYGDSVLMDITDTTAEAGDVASGAVFYAKNGARTVGTFTQAQSDWIEDDTTDPAFILNKPAIISGEGENSISEGMIEDDENATTYTLTINGDANATTFSYTTEDTLPSNIMIRTYGLAYYYRIIATYQSIVNLDTTNSTITLSGSIDSSAITNGVLTIYYKYKKAIGDYSRSEGMYTYSVGSSSHAEGGGSKAIKNQSHAEGYATSAAGGHDHAEGHFTITKATAAHAEGSYTEASGKYSHSEGYYTVANHRSQHVFGEYNIADGSSEISGLRGNYAEIVGNGTADNTRSNARTLDWSGNEVLAGKLTVGAAPVNNMDVATKQYVDGAISSSAITVDAYLDGSSTNPVENSAITNELATKVSKDDGAVIVLLSLNGTTITLDNSILQAYFKLNNATTTYFAISLSENNVIPMQISNVDMVNGTIALYTIIGNLKYSTTLTQVSGANQMTGTLVTETIASVSDIPSASSTAPLSDGTAAVGVSTAYARADHVHPKITQTISMSNNVITLTGSDGSTSSVTLPVYDGTVTSGGGS